MVGRGGAECTEGGLPIQSDLQPDLSGLSRSSLGQTQRRVREREGERRREGGRGEGRKREKEARREGGRKEKDRPLPLLVGPHGPAVVSELYCLYCCVGEYLSRTIRS